MPRGVASPIPLKKGRERENMMKRLMLLGAFCSALCASAKTSTPEGWLDDYDAALAKAAAEGRHVIVNFSGSDWCTWCKSLDEEVFATDAFKKAAAGKYVLLMVDSPMDKSLLTEKAAREHPQLAEKCGVKGLPTVVVLDPTGEEVCRLKYAKGGGPEAYLAKLDSEIRDAPDVKKYIKPIEDGLNRHDAQMQEDSQAAMKNVQEKFPEPPKDMERKERLDARRRGNVRFVCSVLAE